MILPIQNNHHRVYINLKSGKKNYYHILWLGSASMMRSKTGRHFDVVYNGNAMANVRYWKQKVWNILFYYSSRKHFKLNKFYVFVKNVYFYRVDIFTSLTPNGMSKSPIWEILRDSL